MSFYGFVKEKKSCKGEVIVAVLGNERIKYILHVVWNKSIVEYVDDSKMENFVILWPGAVNSYNLEIANASNFRVTVNLEDCAKEQDILACWLKALAKEKDVLHIAINRRIDVSLDVDEEIFRLLKEIVKKKQLGFLCERNTCLY